MIVVDQTTKAIKISKGDYAPITFTLQGYTLQAGDKVFFTVKKCVNDISPLILKQITNDGQSSFIVTITEADLAPLDFGDYLYDVRIEYANATTFTPIYPTLFRVMEVVGNG